MRISTEQEPSQEVMPLVAGGEAAPPATPAASVRRVATGASPGSRFLNMASAMTSWIGRHEFYFYPPRVDEPPPAPRSSASLVKSNTRR